MSVPKVYFAGKISSNYRSNILGSNPMSKGIKKYYIYGKEIFYNGCFTLSNCGYSDSTNPKEIEHNWWDNRHGLSSYDVETEIYSYDCIADLLGDPKFFDSYKKLKLGIFTEETLTGLNTDHPKVFNHVDTNIGLTKPIVNKLCSNLIKTSDVLFAHIDSTDCYGTLAEIGYAAALDKPIFLTFAKNLNHDLISDLWFITEYKSVISSFIVENNGFVDPTLVSISGFEKCQIIDKVDPLSTPFSKIDNYNFYTEHN